MHFALTATKSITDTPTRTQSNANPAAPAGNMEKSLCTRLM
jgi:hypothetical protein